MHTPYVDLKSLLFCSIIYFLNIAGHLLQVGVSNWKIVLDILGLIATLTTVLYNAIKAYGEILGLVRKYKVRKKEKEKKYDPPSEDQFE